MVTVLLESGLSGFVESLRAANSILIDGCQIACGKKAFERHNLNPTKYIVIAELGIEKTHDLSKIDRMSLKH